MFIMLHPPRLVTLMSCHPPPAPPFKSTLCYISILHHWHTGLQPTGRNTGKGRSAMQAISMKEAPCTSLLYRCCYALILCTTIHIASEGSIIYNINKHVQFQQSLIIQSINRCHGSETLTFKNFLYEIIIICIPQTTTTNHYILSLATSKQRHNTYNLIP